VQGLECRDEEDQQESHTRRRSERDKPATSSFGAAAVALPKLAWNRIRWIDASEGGSVPQQRLHQPQVPEKPAFGGKRSGDRVLVFMIALTVVCAAAESRGHRGSKLLVKGHTNYNQL